MILLKNRHLSIIIIMKGEILRCPWRRDWVFELPVYFGLGGISSWMRIFIIMRGEILRCPWRK